MVNLPRPERVASARCAASIWNPLRAHSTAHPILGPPAVPFYPLFLGEGSLQTKIDRTKRNRYQRFSKRSQKSAGPYFEFGLSRSRRSRNALFARGFGKLRDFLGGFRELRSEQHRGKDPTDPSQVLAVYDALGSFFGPFLGGIKIGKWNRLCPFKLSLSG